jgi:cytochrome P450
VRRLAPLTSTYGLTSLVLRLYPPVPVNSRITAKPTTLPRGGGETGEAPVFMRKGEPVCYCPYVMHRRKDIYGPDADDFRPERWDTGAKEYNLNNIGWAYLPFNGGPRICLGRESLQVVSSDWLMIEQKNSPS